MRDTPERVHPEVVSRAWFVFKRPWFHETSIDNTRLFRPFAALCQRKGRTSVPVKCPEAFVAEGRVNGACGGRLVLWAVVSDTQ